jgi:nitrile hydratase accessory protein
VIDQPAMPERPGMADVPGMPRDAGGAVFREPWEAKAFAVAVRLHERGLFTWSEWAQTLASHIEHARAAGGEDSAAGYYVHWLQALETLVAAKGAASREELAAHADAWREAAERTPHGQPIELAGGAAAGTRNPSMP